MNDDRAANDRVRSRPNRQDLGIEREHRNAFTIRRQGGKIAGVMVGRAVLTVRLALRVEMPAGADEVLRRAVALFMDVESELAIGRQPVDIGMDIRLAHGGLTDG